VLIPGVPNTCYELHSLSIASLAAPGEANFSFNGVPFKTLSAQAGGFATCPLSFELPSGSGLNVVTDTALDVTVFYSIVDHTPGITKEAARAASYQASLLSPKAIRTPNRFGGQVEG
jgi:hypothetical protein